MTNATLPSQFPKAFSFHSPLFHPLQVFLKTPDRGLVPLPPVVSNVIKDRKAHSDLQIVDYSDDIAPLEGGKKILIFCEQVKRDDIEVHFTQYTKSEF